MIMIMLVIMLQPGDINGFNDTTNGGRRVLKGITIYLIYYHYILLPLYFIIIIHHIVNITI